MEGRHGEEAHFMVGRKQSGAIVARDQVLESEALQVLFSVTLWPQFRSWYFQSSTSSQQLVMALSHKPVKLLSGQRPHDLTVSENTLTNITESVLWYLQTLLILTKLMIKINNHTSQCSFIFFFV